MSRSVDCRTNLSHDNRAETQVRFQDLPGEVRNEIYKMIAEYKIETTDSRARLAAPSRRWNHNTLQWLPAEDISPVIAHPSLPLPPKENPRLMILQPGLFLTCKQIRTEGLLFFYQKRNFSFDLNGGNYILYKFGPNTFTKWFEAIGKFGQQNIRHLRFRNPPSEHSRSRTCIFRRLSEKATVMYSVELQLELNKRYLWEIANAYHTKNPDKMPVLWTPAGIKEFADLKLWHEWVPKLPLELRFEPECNWFGPYPRYPHGKQLESDETGRM